MIILCGQGASSGISFGKIHWIRHRERSCAFEHREDSKAEAQRFEYAKECALLQLEELYRLALLNTSEKEAFVFQVHQMMLEDLDFCTSILDLIETNNANAEYAVATASQSFAAMFSSMEDPYLQSRSADVMDISQRLICLLSSNEPDFKILEEPVIIVADDLSPSETIRLSRDKVLAFAIAKGSLNSHTAILARAMGIPAVIGLGDSLLKLKDGDFAAIDGDVGQFYLSPDESTTCSLHQKQENFQLVQSEIEDLTSLPDLPINGHKLAVCANLESLDGVEAAIRYGANGIGLFRSEFLYLQSNGYPSEESQFEVYRAILQAMNGKRVVIRTLDIGSDKQVDYFQLPHEENPALGLRSIRVCFARPEIFKTQLRALYRSSLYGTLAIMFPLIVSLWEVQKIKEIIKEVQQELESEQIPFNSTVEIGIMIETPASAVISDLLAKEVDFFSIGTNDLTQYTLALDRQNASLDFYYDKHHEAILRLIRTTVQNAQKVGIRVGICGELAADLSLTEYFLSVGVDELSVSPPSILPLRKKIRKILLEP